MMLFRKLALAASALLMLGGCAGDLLDDREIVYVAVGASDAFGVGAIPITNGYVFEIDDALDDQGRDTALVNLGIPGADTDQIRPAVEIFSRTGIEAQLVTVWVGNNDIIAGVEVDDFAEELDRLLDLVQDDIEGFVVIGNIPKLDQLPVFRDNPDDDVTPERIDGFNEVITDAANARGIPIIDLFSEEVEDDLVSDIDGFHPNNDGHQRLAELFLAVILEEL